ncbi:MAG: penicillin-binding protein activator LpoB, partial [Archangium sp.]
PDEGPGQQVRADYVLTGQSSSTVQRSGNGELVYFKLAARLHDVRTGLVEWTDEKELRKTFETKPVSW